MANLPETEDFAEGIYRIETSDRVLGGPGGIANKQAEQLGNRTAWLRNAIKKIVDGTTTVAVAAKLATARTFKFKGDASGSGSFDGDGDTEITLTLADSGIAAGTFTKVQFNVKGLAVSGSNPTSLAGYGITDALRVGVVSQQLPILAAPGPGGTDGSGTGGALQIREAQAVGNTKTDLSYAPRVLFHWQGLRSKDLAMSSVGDLLWGGSTLWHAGNFDPAVKANTTDVTASLGLKANKAITLAGYNIGDAFTKDQTVAEIAAALKKLVGAAPELLDQIDEIAKAIGNDPNFAVTMMQALSLKADLLTSLRVGSISRQRPVLSGTVPASADGGVDGTGGAIEIREINEVGVGQTDLKWAPSILFNWSGKFARYLKMSVLGELIWGDKRVWTEGNFTPATAVMTASGRLMVPTASGVFYIQWYEGPLAGAESVVYPAISHPVPFPNQCLFAGVFTRSTSGNTLSDQMFQTEYWDRLGVKVFPQWFGTGNQSLVKPLILTIGN